jgi:hypothetical protein
MSVNTQGANYFVGKPESTLTKYFGYEGEIYDGEGEYDKIIYFTNKVIRLTATKQKVTRYKTSESKLVSRVFFAEFDDGCLHWLGDDGHGIEHYELVNVGNTSATGSTIKMVFRHTNNENVFVNNEIKKFNSEIQRLKAVPSTDQQAAFQRTNIGSWYYFYQTKDTVKTRYAGAESTTSSGGGSTIGESRYETSVWHVYDLYRVDVKADDRIETESHTVAIYNEYEDSFYDGNGNTISLEREAAIYADYEEKGFDIITNESGISVLAYIRDGKIVKVE